MTIEKEKEKENLLAKRHHSSKEDNAQYLSKGGSGSGKLLSTGSIGEGWGFLSY